MQYDQSIKAAAAGAGGPYMIVGFEVQPCSVKRAPGKPIANVDCGPDADRPPEAQEIKEGEAVVYSYDVFWCAVVGCS